MIISSRRLSMTYGTGGSATHALAGVDLDIEAGSLAIMGPSGSGKTTLLHCLAGILRPTGGEITLRGQSLTTMSDRERTALRRTDFGFVFQSGQLLAELPACENVALPLMLDGVRRTDAVGRANQWLAAIGLAGMENRRPGELSGGQAQRVAIARALVTEPSVVFADEPTGALDQQTGQDVMQVLVGAVTKAGTALVVVTHDPGVARHCRRTIVMQDGRITAEHHAPGAVVAEAVDGPAPGAGSFVRNGPSTGSGPWVGNGPSTSSGPSVGNGPSTSSGPSVGNGSSTSSGPSVGNGPSTGSGPFAGNGPSTGSGPWVGNGPSTSSGPWVGNGPSTGSGPVAGVR